VPLSVGAPGIRNCTGSRLRSIVFGVAVGCAVAEGCGVADLSAGAVGAEASRQATITAKHATKVAVNQRWWCRANVIMRARSPPGRDAYAAERSAEDQCFLRFHREAPLTLVSCKCITARPDDAVMRALVAQRAMTPLFT